MNNTNRALNRTFIFVVGLILLAAGAAAAALQFWPWWADQWQYAGRQTSQFVADALEASPVPGTGFSWWMLAALAVLLLLVIGMILLIASVGGGGSREIYRSPSSTRAGRPSAGADQVVLDTSFAVDALKNSLDKRPDLVSSSVGAFTVSRQPVLHIGVTPRQGTSPRLVADEVDTLLRNLALVVGDAPASCLTIQSGLRAQLGRNQRVL
ncbi:Trp biosynthesis-associated membrane protein [Cryobacterium sp. SO2]|uniref:Trp biosynthesis-associated membrane protein n=1 Tax=Cryobacterium sp. SO2 TaxID=1897060 RepID=UPI00223C8F95|nr:Trp biosynthesis-associated membrane protein [Cryobacterium sp. SO2]WEO76376.1 Trp biosynthesis-associated membrane protein [Cryobacterium sp. SO2]